MSGKERKNLYKQKIKCFTTLPSYPPYAIIRASTAKGSGAMKANAEALWKIFEQTGSIAVYIFYRKMSLQ